MGFVAALAVFLAVWNNAANRVGAFHRWYVPVNLAVAAALLWLGQVRGLSWESMGLSAAALPAGLAWGGLVAAGVAAGLLAVLATPRVRPWLRDARVAGQSPRQVAVHAGVRIPLGTVALEEVAFRGVLLAAWADAQGLLAAVVGSSVVFGIWHVVPTLLLVEANRPGAGLRTRAVAVAGAVTGTALAGVGLCLLRLASGSLVAPALAHWAANGLSALAAAVAWRGGPPRMLRR